MATSLLSPIASASEYASHKSSFLQSSTHSKPFAATQLATRRKSLSSRRLYSYKPPSAKNYDHIPKQFREENLKEGLMENYKNVPKHLYGLTPSQLDMFMTEDNPVGRQSDSVNEESISSAWNYSNHGGMYNLKGMNGHVPSKYSMRASMYAGGRRGMRTAPPDLPSLLLDSRVVYLGMPIVPAVTELIVAQFMWLDYDNNTKPIYLYINSPGTQNEKRESLAFETEAYAIADCISFCKAGVYTVNVARAFGQAAMLLSLGTKGYRGLQPNSCAKLYLPKVHRSSGPASDMWIKAKELDANTDYYLELLAKGTGKSKEELHQDIQRPRFFQAQQAIEYGLADKIIQPWDTNYEKRDYEGMLAQSRAMRRAGRGGPQSAPAGFS